jgi:hypothetical protein
MDLDALQKLLEIDAPQDFTFFEQFAELVETDEDIPVETLAALFSEVDKDALTELIDAYFEDVLNNIPDDSSDMFTLLTTIGKALVGLVQTEELEEAHGRFAEEFYKFKAWYQGESEVHCANKVDGTELDLTVLQAMALYRAEHLNNEEYSYDFSDALDYPIDEYIVPLDVLEMSEQEDEDDYSDNDERWTDDI